MTILRFRTTGLMLGVLACAAFGFSGTAQADKDKGKGHGHKSEKHHEDRDDHGDRESRHQDNFFDRDSGRWITVTINDDDRREIHHYLNDDYRRNCPPGLAKKHNGCMPPGQAKKYRVGERLPPEIIFVPVPRDLREHLGPVPQGYQYVQVDQDVLLISEASKKVIDAVTLLSAIGN